MKKNLFIGAFVSLCLLVFIFYRIDFDKLISIIRQVRLSYLMPAIVVMLLTLLIRAWRWQSLLNPIKCIHTSSLFSITAIGFMANMLLPARAGEVIRAYMLGEKEQVSKMTSLATIVVERTLDMVSILSIFAMLLIFVTLPQETTFVTRSLRIGGYVAFLFCGVVIGGLWFVQVNLHQTMTFLQRRLAFLPTRWVDKLTDLLPAFVVGLQAMRHRQHFIPIVAWSLVLWTALALVNFLILSSFHLSLPFYAPFLLLIVQAFGVTIPSGPGFVGTYHAAVVAGVSMFSVSQETALSVAIIMHAAFFFPFILTGLLFLWTENFSWRALSIVKARET